MRGDPLPQIVERSIKFRSDQSRRKVIRDTLEVIEKVIRFDVVQLMSCYCAVLIQAFEELGVPELAKSVPPIPLYLEVGASDRSMVSFMSLGLSRVTAAILNDATVNKEMSVSDARIWLRAAPLEALDLSPLLIGEIQRAIA
jgi:hypothetical protein